MKQNVIQSQEIQFILQCDCNSTLGSHYHKSPLEVSPVIILEYCNEHKLVENLVENCSLIKITMSLFRDLWYVLVRESMLECGRLADRVKRSFLM